MALGLCIQFIGLSTRRNIEQTPNKILNKGRLNICISARNLSGTLKRLFCSRSVLKASTKSSQIRPVALLYLENHQKIHTVQLA
jgi:hypothetical protein